MAFQPFGDVTENNFKLIPIDTTIGTRVKCILRAYKEGFEDIVLETLPVTITERPILSGSDIYLSDRADGDEIQTILDNNFIFAVDDIVGEDGVTYEFYVKYPAQLEVLESGSGYAGVSGDYGSSLPGWVVGGVTVEHKPYFGGTTDGLTAAVGDQTAYGADETVIASWTAKNAYIMDEDLDEDHYYVSLQAYHHSGIEKVQFQLNDGPVLEVSDTLQHPIDDVEEYICKIDINDPNLKTLNEVRAIVYPNNGRKLLMQGFGYYERLFYGGDVTGGITGEIAAPEVDNDYVSFNSNGDELYYESLFLFKRTDGYTGEIYFDYENGSNASGDGSFDNPYQTIAVGVQKYITEQLGYDFNPNSSNPAPPLDGYTLKLKPGNHIIRGYDNFAWYSSPEYGKYFPTVITSSDVNNRAVIIGCTGEVSTNPSRDNAYSLGTLYCGIIRDLDIVEGEITYPSGANATIKFDNPSFGDGGGELGVDPLGKYFTTLHAQNLNITYPNDTRVILESEDPPNTAEAGELAFKWASPHVGNFNPNYPPTNSIKSIYYAPVNGLHFGSKTNCVTKYTHDGAGSIFTELVETLSRGNTDYSGWSSRGYVAKSSVNNTLIGTSLEVPTEAQDDIDNNTSPTAWFWTAIHVDACQSGNGKFQPGNGSPNKINYYPRVFSYNTSEHKDYTKKGFGVKKSQLIFEGDAAYRTEVGTGSSGGYRWEVGQGVMKNQAFVNNAHLKHGTAWSLAVGSKENSPGNVQQNYYVAGNTFSKIDIGGPYSAYKTWTYKNNYMENGDFIVEPGPSRFVDATLAFPAIDANDVAHMYSPFYNTLETLDPIPVVYEIIPSLYPVDAPGGSAGGDITYVKGTGGYDSYYGLDVYDNTQILVQYDGISAPNEVSASLQLKFMISFDESQEYLKPELLNVTDGYLRNMQWLDPFGITFEYQWKRDGVDISGATGFTYSINYSTDVGHTLSCGITVQEILPYVNPVDLRTGFSEMELYVRGNSFDVPSTGQWVVGQPEYYSLDGEDGCGFESYILGRHNTLSGISGPNKIPIVGFWHKTSISEDIQYIFVNSESADSYWERHLWFNEDGTDPTIHQPYRKLINLDTGISFDYEVGLANTDYIKSGTWTNYARTGYPDAFSYQLNTETDSSIPLNVLTMLRDAADNNQRILHAYARVPQELPYYILYYGIEDSEFVDYSRVWFGEYNSNTPSKIARVNNSSDVAYALMQAVGNDIPFAVRCGGHSYIGESIVDDGIVIDLRNLDGITLDGTTATIGGGALSWQVDREINCSTDRKLFVASGAYVGFSGYMLAGGLNSGLRRYGLPVDLLEEAEVVLADGRIVTARADNSYSDLFHGLKGLGTSSLGIVTEWKVNTHAGFTGTSARYSWQTSAGSFDIDDDSTWNTVIDVFDRWQTTLTTMSDSVDSICSIRMVNENTFDILVTFYVTSGDENILSGVTGSFLTGIPSPSATTVLETTNNQYNCSTSFNEDYTPSNAGLVYGLNQSMITSTTIDSTQSITSLLSFYKEMRDKINGSDGSPLNGLSGFSGRFLCDGWGGAMSGGTGTFAYRDGIFSTQFFTNSSDFSGNTLAKEEAENIQRRYFEDIQQNYDRGGYLGYLDKGITGPTYDSLDYYYGSNRQQFEALKLKYDPNNVFPYGPKI